MIPVIIGTLGIVTLKKMASADSRNNTTSSRIFVQKSALLGTANLLYRTLNFQASDRGPEVEGGSIGDEIFLII